MKNLFHVLIIDDDRALCRTLSATVAEAGYRVDCLSGDEKPHRAVRDLSPDLLILDISFPGNGLETLRRLKVQRSTRDIPVIVTSTQSALEYELLDVFDFLSKPVDEKRIVEDLASAFRQRTGGRSGPLSLSGSDLDLFQNYLHHHSGLHFDQGNVKILERGLIRRMRALNLADFRHYYEYLEKFAQSRRELNKLLGLLTVGETYFFRFLPHFEALSRAVIPDILQRNRRRRSLRIWSAGCSTGEEPYSLAMLLSAHFPQLQGWEVEILGTDINKRALEAAREGLYGPRSLRVMDPVYRSRYFQPVGPSFRVREEIRRMVRFAYLNLQTCDYPDPSQGTADVDVLFCRNVMIYFRHETVRRIVERFSRCLSPGGRLFLGHSETMTGISDRFARESKAEGFFYRLKEAEGPPAPQKKEMLFEGGLSPVPFHPPVSLPPAFPALVLREEPPRPLPTSTAELYERGTQAFLAEEFTRASELFEEILELDPRHIGALLGKGFVLANQGLYRPSLDLCARIHEIDDLRPEAYFLQGMVLEATEDQEGAIREYRRALLLDMDFVMPHYNLSRLYRRLGRDNDSRRELNTCVRLLEQAAPEALIPHSGGLSREVFMEICREDLEKQEKKK